MTMLKRSRILENSEEVLVNRETDDILNDEAHWLFMTRNLPSAELSEIFLEWNCAA